MSKGENRIIGRRLANAYLSSVISISLVLLLVGVAAMLLVNARSISGYFKENMKVSVLLKQDVPETDALCSGFGRSSECWQINVVQYHFGKRQKHC